jgi:hypothetical protein
MAARLVRLVKPFVDEVAVAVDEQMSDAGVGLIASEQPTRMERIPHVHPNERATVYIHHLCQTGWVLRLSGDEVPSLSLLRNLRQLAADPRLTHYVIPMFWLWPDVGSVLHESPWWRDMHVRFFRSDPAILHYPGLTHTGLDLAGNHRYLETPIYHLVFLVTRRNTLQQKVARYERERPELLSMGEPFNERWYFPDRRNPPPQTTPSPGEDINCLREVLGTSLEDAGPPLLLPVAPLADVDAGWPTKPWADEAYRACLEIADDNLHFNFDSVETFFVWVGNNGNETWPSALASAPLIRLSYHWHKEDDDAVVVWDGLRTPLPGPLAPGERILVPVQVASPGPGNWILELDLVYEGVRWFNQSRRISVKIS